MKAEKMKGTLNKDAKNGKINFKVIERGSAFYSGDINTMINKMAGKQKKKH